MEFINFIHSLTVPQKRALACQAGIVEWPHLSEGKLSERLFQNARVVDIYEEHYGSI